MNKPVMALFADMFLKAERISGFPADVLMAIAVLESGWFKYETGRFNYMGIKAKATDIPDKAKLCLTRELLNPEQIKTMREDERATLKSLGASQNGKTWYTCKCWFRSFDSIEQSAVHFTKVFLGGRYQSAVNAYKMGLPSLTAKDALLTAIQKAGYSTGPAAVEEMKLLRHKELQSTIELARARVTKDGTLNV